MLKKKKTIREGLQFITIPHNTPKVQKHSGLKLSLFIKDVQERKEVVALSIHPMEDSLPQNNIILWTVLR